MRCDGDDTTILGIIKIGTIEHNGGKPDVLRNSLLEASPAHQFGREGRQYHGIGRVLVARLIVESKVQGAKGRLLVRPVADSIKFYEQIGFRPSSDRNYILDAEKPEELLNICMSLPRE